MDTPVQPNPFEGDLGNQLRSVRRLTKQEVLSTMPAQALANIVERLGKEIWVVLDKTGGTVLQDPSTRQPFFHNNRKFAEQVAKEVGGHAVLYADALKAVTDRNRNQ